MDTPHTDDDSELEELLSQLEDESLLELKLTSFRLGSGRFVTQGSNDVLSQDLEKRYETLKAQSFGSREQVDNRADGIASTPFQTETEDLKEPLQAGSEVKSAEESESLNVVKPDVESLPKSSTQQVAAAKKYPPSPSPSPPARCSCFCMSSRKPIKKQKQSHGNQRSDGKAGRDQEDDDEWARVVKGLEEEDLGVDAAEMGVHASLFDVKKTNKEFKRASKKEMQLTQEAAKFVEWVASSSSRFSLSPDHAPEHSDLSSKHP